MSHDQHDDDQVARPVRERQGEGGKISAFRRNVYKVTMMMMIVVMMAIMMANISLSRTTRLQGNDFDDSCDNGDDDDETLQYQK